jgi:formate hydrogenlyase subunit 6/NADH:ubiquinone oxidoreductase subunit I
MGKFKMSKLAFRSALKKPPTHQYPLEARKPVAGSRGQLLLIEKDCVYCTACAKKCPTAALVVDRAGKTLEVDRLRCISCGYCVEICPKDALKLTTSHGAPETSHERRTPVDPSPNPSPDERSSS